MSTVREIIFKIKERHTGFNITDDYPVIDALIYSFMNDARESLIREEYNNTRQVNDQYYQMLCCLEIECLGEQCTYGNVTIINTDNDLYKVKLPLTIPRVGNLDIKYLGSKNGRDKFDRFNFLAFGSIKSRVWTKAVHSYSVVGGEIWLKNLYTPNQKFVCALVLLKDPVDACNWDDETSQYPVPSEKKLVDLVLYSLQTSTKVSDVLNNAADDTSIPKINQEVVAQQQNALRNDEQQQRR